MSPLIHRQAMLAGPARPKRKIVRAYMTHEQYKALKRAAKLARKTISAVICEAVSNELERS